ncbi:MAG TPA: cytochrome C oxidase subunit IV family protein [Verrucomicrobiae bacterium]|jgi:cytochrome c oxidase subunit 4
MNASATSQKSLWKVWAALLTLLALTWLAARFNLGLWNTVIALVISGMKMTLVILFFMQVRYSSRLIWIFACAGFIWWMIFVSLAMTDYLTRREVVPYQRQSPNTPAQGAPARRE